MIQYDHSKTQPTCSFFQTSTISFVDFLLFHPFPGSNSLPLICNCVLIWLHATPSRSSSNSIWLGATAYCTWKVENIKFFGHLKLTLFKAKLTTMLETSIDRLNKSHAVQINEPNNLQCLINTQHNCWSLDLELAYHVRQNLHVYWRCSILPSCCQGAQRSIDRVQTWYQQPKGSTNMVWLRCVPMWPGLPKNIPRLYHAYDCIWV